MVSGETYVHMRDDLVIFLSASQGGEEIVYLII